MKHFIKTVCIVLSIVTFCSMPVCADEGSTYSSAFFSSYDSELRNPTINIIQIWIDVEGNGKMDEIGASVIYMERSSDGVNWTTVQTYRSENYLQMIEEDTGINCSYVTHYGTYGYYYRAYVTFYAKKGTGRGYTWEYSEVLYLSAP